MRVDPQNEAGLLRTLIDHIPDCYIFVKDAQSRFITTNRTHLKTLGVESVEEVVGRTDFDFFPKELAEQYYADEQKVITTHEPVVDREEQTVDPEGKVTWLLTTKVPLRAEDGTVVGVVGISRDITRRKSLEKEIKQQSVTDDLTGAYNRRFLSRDLPIVFNLATRTANAISMIMCDIDVLKEINDTYGHAVGDEALRTFASSAREVLRRATDVMIRYGGDEFLLVLFNVDPSAAEEFARQLLQKLRRTDISAAAAGGGPVHVTFSAGVAGVRGIETIDSMMKRADTALLAAKEQGRNRVVRYTSELAARPYEPLLDPPHENTP